MYVFFIISHIFDSTATFPPSLKEMPGHDADAAAFWSGRTGSRVDWLPLEFKLIRPPRLCVGAGMKKELIAKQISVQKKKRAGFRFRATYIVLRPCRLRTCWSSFEDALVVQFVRHGRHCHVIRGTCWTCHLGHMLSTPCGPDWPRGVTEVRLFVLRTGTGTAGTPSSRPCSGTSRRSPPKKSKSWSGLRRSCSVFLVMNVSHCFVIRFHIVCSVQ